MVGGSSQKKPAAKRWMLRSPRGKPRANAKGNIDSPLQRVQPPEERSESSDGMNLQRQENAQQAPLTDRPDAGELHARDRVSDTEAASCPDEECPTSITSAAGSSTKRVYTIGKTSGRRSPSPMSQLRRKSPVSIVGIMKRFRRGKLPKQAVTGGESSVGRQRSSARADGGSTDTNNRKANTPPLQGGGGKSAREEASATEKERGGDEAIVPTSVLQSKCGSRQVTGTIRDSSIRDSSISISCKAACSSVSSPECKSKHVVAQPPPTVQRGMSHDQTKLDVGADALAAVKNGQQPPRIAFIGVFLSGVAVALASFVPFGSAAARTALVKAVLLEPSISVLPGGCYTARGSVLAVHIVVDHKHRVYACVAAEDVPFSLALSLLEEVQIEYISTTSTLAFSTRENSHNSRCHAHMARSWAKYEAVEHTLVRERETRRRLGEAPLDIESPLSRDNKSYSGAEVVPFGFNEEHQPALLDAELEISSLLEEDEERRYARDVACGEADRAAAVVGKRRKIMTRTAALLATGVSIVLGASYAARRAYLSF